MNAHNYYTPPRPLPPLLLPAKKAQFYLLSICAPYTWLSLSNLSVRFIHARSQPIFEGEGCKPCWERVREGSAPPGSGGPGLSPRKTFWNWNVRRRILRIQKAILWITVEWNKLKQMNKLQLFLWTIRHIVEERNKLLPRELWTFGNYGGLQNHKEHPLPNYGPVIIAFTALICIQRAICLAFICQKSYSRCSHRIPIFAFVLAQVYTTGTQRRPTYHSGRIL